MTRRAARGSIFVRLFLFAILSIGIAVSFLAVPPSYAQEDYASSDSISESYSQLNLDSNVPQDLNTLSQAVTIEVLSAITCQLSGINTANPQRPCLGLNPQTNKLGYATQDKDKEPQIGGALGFMSGSISTLYTPTVSTSEYVRYLSSNFGIVKTVSAQENTGIGFDGLSPVRVLWTLTRDLAYALLVLIFILIGVGVMLRIKIDPRTVMSIQNQIPRVVIALLLITFSYGIAGVLIDIMWTTTYVGINAVAEKSNLNFTCDGKQKQLGQHATGQLLDTPIGFFNQVFRADDASIEQSDGESSDCGWTRVGIFNVTSSVGNALGDIIQGLLKSLILTNPNETCLETTGPIPTGINLGACLLQGAGGLIGWVMRIIILVAILIALFRIWFELLKAYVYILLYVIAAPIWIVMGLIPGRPLGWENWLRLMFVNLAVFPITAILLVVARVIMEAFGNPTPDSNFDPTKVFIPPLVGNPFMPHFGTLIAFGILLMAPGLLTMLREKMKVPGIKGGAIAGTLGQASGVAGAPAAKSWAYATRKDPKTGAGIGPVSRFISNKKSNLITRMATKSTEAQKATGASAGKFKTWVGDKAQTAQERRENEYKGYGRMSDQELEQRGIDKNSYQPAGQHPKGTQPQTGAQGPAVTQPQTATPPQGTAHGPAVQAPPQAKQQQPQQQPQQKPSGEAAPGQPQQQQPGLRVENLNVTAARADLHLPEAIKSSPQAKTENPGVLKTVAEKVKDKPWKDTSHSNLLPHQLAELSNIMNEARAMESHGANAGAQGPAGQTGAPGVGHEGTGGLPGAQGNTGSTGASGHEGYTGATGTSGIAGAHGEHGAAGREGATGSHGEQGHEGAPGAQGQQGKRGPMIRPSHGGPNPFAPPEKTQETPKKDEGTEEKREE